MRVNVPKPSGDQTHSQASASEQIDDDLTVTPRPWSEVWSDHVNSTRNALARTARWLRRIFRAGAASLRHRPVWVLPLVSAGSATLFYARLPVEIRRAGSLLGAREDKVGELASALASSGHTMHADNQFAVAVAATLALIAVAWEGKRHTVSARRWSAFARLTTIGCAFGYLWFDLDENRRVSRYASTDNLRGLGRATNLKAGFFLVAGLLLLSTAGRRLPIGRGGNAINPPGYRYDPNEQPPGADWSPSSERLGIAVSGGGIRSASFALGALQELHQRGLLQRARYVASASGGSYITGAMTVSNRASEPDRGERVDAPPYSPGGPEEQKLRRNLDYLIGNKRVAASAVARLLVGLLINLVLLCCLVFVFVRPVGWLIGSSHVHPELRLQAPVVTDVGRPPTFCEHTEDELLGGCQQLLGEVTALPGGTDGPKGSLYSVSLRGEARAGEATPSIAADTLFSICVVVEVRPSGPSQEILVPVVQALPAVVQVIEGNRTVLRQPVLKMGSSMSTPCRAKPQVAQTALPVDVPADNPRLVSVRTLARELEFPRQPKIALDSSALIAAGEPLTIEQVRLTESPTMRNRTAVLQHDPLHMTTGDWRWPLLIVCGGISLFLIRMVARPRHWKFLNATATIVVIVGSAALLLEVILPWLVDLYPRKVTAGLSNPPTGSAKLPLVGTLPGGFLAYLVLSVSTIRRYMSKPKKVTDPTKTVRANAKALTRKITRIVQRTFVGAVLVGLGTIVLLNVLVVGVANGPNGHLAWLSHDLFGLALPFPPDLFLWAGVCALLLVSASQFEASTWALGPVYKRRLYWAFGLRRTGPKAEHVKLPDDRNRWDQIVLPMSGRTASAEHLLRPERAGFVDGRLGDGTELVLCCAANVVGQDRAPTGRRAASFTVSRSHVGGPEIGWIDTPTYLARMGKRRGWDLTIPSVVGISGAAVSPAMGKQSLGPIGSLLAMLNVRLGAWLPHPRWVMAMDQTSTWDHNPGWPWFVREVARRHRIEAPYLYVTDGGHWENLGLVEVLRRGCANVVCVSAAGDGEYSLSTLGEAIEIARTDLGVEITLDDAWETRPRVGGDPDSKLPSGRQYLMTADVTPSIGRAAPKAYASGRIEYPDGTRGRLLYLDAVMVDNLPVDVHAYAEKHAEFPNISTGDQFFDASDFEAYRALAHHITATALDSQDGHLFSAAISRCTRADAPEPTPTDQGEPVGYVIVLESTQVESFSFE
jgi:Lysophospholipase catalytic domain